MDRMKNAPKVFLFHLIVLLPLILLICISSCLVSGVLSVRKVDYDNMQKGMEGYLASEKGKLNFSEDGTDLVMTYLYKYKDVVYKPEAQRFPMDTSGAERLVYIYGSSPLVTKLFSTSKSALFPARLEDKLNSSGGTRFKVLNFGVISFDSFDIKELVKVTVGRKRPDIIIYYEGHMDYEAAYMASVKRHFFILRRGFYVKALDWIIEHKLGGIYKFFLAGDWILRSAVEPNLLNLMQRSGLVSIDKDAFAGCNRLILDHYRRNLDEVIAAANGAGVPVVFVTPIANMEARPFGIYDITEKYYDQAMQEEDYAARMAYLAKARDSEIFTGDLRAKSGLYDFLRGLSVEGVYVMDLERELLDENFPFNYTYFYDIGHMKPELHEIVAERLYRFLVREGLVAEGDNVNKDKG